MQCNNHITVESSDIKLNSTKRNLFILYVLQSFLVGLLRQVGHFLVRGPLCGDRRSRSWDQQPVIWQIIAQTDAISFTTLRCGGTLCKNRIMVAVSKEQRGRMILFVRILTLNPITLYRTQTHRCQSAQQTDTPWDQVKQTLGDVCTKRGVSNLSQRPFPIADRNKRLQASSYLQGLCFHTALVRAKDTVQRIQTSQSRNQSTNPMMEKYMILDRLCSVILSWFVKLAKCCAPRPQRRCAHGSSAACANHETGAKRIFFLSRFGRLFNPLFKFLHFRNYGHIILSQTKYQ